MYWRWTSITTPEDTTAGVYLFDIEFSATGIKETTDQGSHHSTGANHSIMNDITITTETNNISVSQRSMNITTEEKVIQVNVTGGRGPAGKTPVEIIVFIRQM